MTLGGTHKQILAQSLRQFYVNDYVSASTLAVKAGLKYTISSFHKSNALGNTKKSKQTNNSFTLEFIIAVNYRQTP